MELRKLAELLAGYYLGHSNRQLVQRDQAWMGFFDHIADHIADEIRPSTVLDVGCAKGLLVEALRQRGIEAFGAEIFEPDLRKVPLEIRPYCWAGPVTGSFPQRYDLIVCLEALRNLPSHEAEQAVVNFCQHSSDVLFSSISPDDEGSISKNAYPPEYWVELFARRSFCRDLDFDASFISPWAIRFRKISEPPTRVIVAYEQRVCMLEREGQLRRELNIELRNELMAKEAQLMAKEAQLRNWETRWAILEGSIGWALLNGLQRFRARLAPPGSVRDQCIDDAIRALRERRLQELAEVVCRIRGAFLRQTKLFLWKLRMRFSPPRRSRTIQINAIETRPPIQTHQSLVEIIICVHNALAAVQRCLESVERHTSQPYSLILVDDGSDSQTRDYLAEFASVKDAALLRNEKAKGYTRAANQGLRHSSSDYVILLNSDTVVTPGWLDRLIACVESDPRIGLVGPLSNTASWQSIPEIESYGDWAANPLPEGVTIDAMSRLVAKYSARLYPSMPFLNGFCLLIRRQLIRETGFFDEKLFGDGYGEEDDYALRARKAGWQLALADDAYVYHAQSQSYSNERRKKLSERAGRLLAKKHGQHIISEGVAICQHGRVLQGIRVRSHTMAARQEWIKKGLSNFEGRRVLFLLPIVAPGGGGNVVIDEAKAMQEMRVDVNLFNLTIYRDRFERAYPAQEIPVVYGEVEHLAVLASEYDAVIATFYITVEWLALIARQGGRPVCGYYIQDFEPYMHSPETESFQKAWDSYYYLPDLVRFTKTEWTRQEVKEQIGVDSAVVGVSLNIDLFRPRPRPGAEWPDRPLKVAAMIRPNSPYRAPRLTMELLQRTSQHYGRGVEILIFGVSPDDPDFIELPRDFAWTLAGVLNPKQVARLLNEVDIFVDFSSHQAMGLTALEAMACGVAVIVPSRGGAVSFARQEENSLVVDTSSAEACWHALQRLIEDHELRSRLQQNALVDVCDFFPERPAFKILETLFESEE